MSSSSTPAIVFSAGGFFHATIGRRRLTPVATSDEQQMHSDFSADRAVRAFVAVGGVQDLLNSEDILASDRASAGAAWHEPEPARGPSVQLDRG